jgi:hypothetical protein
MRRTIATLPDSVAELCLLRLGIQARGLRGLLVAARLKRAIDRSASEAIAQGAGLLHSERFSHSRRHFGVFQYWRSYDELETWSHRPPHSEWWREAVERMRTRGDLGVYHETFLVPRDRVESIYLDCTPAGLSVFGVAGEPRGASTSSRARLGMLGEPAP